MPTVIIATIYASFGGGNGRRGGETMDNEEIFTEYEKEFLAISKALSEAMPTAKQIAEQIVKNVAELSLPIDAVLDPETMEFVTPEELKRRDAENVKRLQEISGK